MDLGKNNIFNQNDKNLIKITTRALEDPRKDFLTFHFE